MTVQRISFQDKGQDFLWWEIDMETGRILGCGPYLADLWADGHCSVDIATIALGERPTFFGRSTGPEGRRLSYAVTQIEPAKSGGVWPLPLTGGLRDG